MVRHGHHGAGCRLHPADFRGREFASHSEDLRGNMDASISRSRKSSKRFTANISRPAPISSRPILSTPTPFFGRIRPAGSRATPELRRSATARHAADNFAAAPGGRRCFVAGSMGPTARTAASSREDRPGILLPAWRHLRPSCARPTAPRARASSSRRWTCCCPKPPSTR